MNFPHALKWYRFTKVSHRLAAIAFVAEDIMEVQQYSTVGGFSNLRRENAVRHLTWPRGEITDRVFERHGHPGRRSAALNVLRRLSYAFPALRWRKKKSGTHGLVGSTRRGMREAIEAQVVADPGWAQSGNIT
jgi:hypothetical protein